MGNLYPSTASNIQKDSDVEELDKTGSMVVQGRKFQNRDEIFYILKKNLKHICSPLTRNLRNLYAELTPREVQVINLVREGRTSKDISEIMGVSSKAVEFHRDNIRRKLGITNKKTNLLSFILSMEGLTQK